jgi:ATP-binding cassette subfamily F protein 3
MLKIHDLTYSIEGRPLFENASATIPTGHKVGLVGPNGAGKTTLFRIIRGEIANEGGAIEMAARARIGGVAQEVPSSGTSLIDTVLAADVERDALMKEAETAADPIRIGEIHARLTDIDAWSAEGRAASILKGLGFDAEAQLRPCSDYSGGWRMRVALAGVLFAQPDVLLLDEPTNYLDLEGALWLEQYLAKYPHTVIIISHDRGLLNRAVGSILHLDQRKLTLYTGTYDQFARARAEQRAVQVAEAKKQDARRAHLQSFVDRFKAKASKAAQAQARVKMLEKMETITPPEEAKGYVFSFPNPEELSPPIINIEGAGVGYDGKPILRHLDLRIDQDDRIALLGRNGEGKSTLSKFLAGKLEAMGGKITRSSKLRVGYFAQHQVDELHLDETPIQHLQSIYPNEGQARIRARLAGFGLGVDQADTKVGRLSGGQKARLSLMLATTHAPHILILDEPTNHLDIESREALVEALNSYSGAVILVSHDMHLLSLVADRLWLVKGGAVTPYTQDLEAYRKELLAGDPAEKPVKAEKPKAVKPPRDEMQALRNEARKSEERVTKLADMIVKLDKILADQSLYLPGRAQEAQKWQLKHSEATHALTRAEALWVEALEKLEKAGK